MSYADITFKDKNPIKRWLQNQRLVSAIQLSDHLPQRPERICDFGGGNGELCKLIVQHHENARVFCYEPTPSFLAQAQQNLSGMANVTVCQQVHELEHNTFDLVFCLEVFEHLPPKETLDALQTMYDLLRPGGTLVVGVPVEIGLPALYKGMFRMIRRYGAFDATVRHITQSMLLCPPAHRPRSEITPGFQYHFHHMGFDFRRFRDMMSRYFTMLTITASPFPMLGAWVMPEIYFVGVKADITRA